MQGADHVGRADHGVAATQRHRGVAGVARHDHAELCRALLADQQVVEAFTARQLQELATALVQQVVAAHEVGALRGEPAGAAHGALFLVGLGHEHELAGEVAAVLEQPAHGHGEGGQQVLHVDGAAPPDVAVLHDAGKGRLVPLVGRRRHDVLVRHERQARPRARAGQRDDEAAPPGRLAHDLAAQTETAKVLVEERGHGRLVAGRVGRVDADQGGEQLARLALHPGDQGGIDAGDVHRRLLVLGFVRMIPARAGRPRDGLARPARRRTPRPAASSARAPARPRPPASSQAFEGRGRGV